MYIKYYFIYKMEKSKQNTTLTITKNNINKENIINKKTGASGSKNNISKDNIINKKTGADGSKNIINKGTGAGGSKTNYNGKKFEDKTNNQSRLLESGYTKNNFTKTKKLNDYYLSKTFENKTIIFLLQNSFKKYMKNKYNIELFRSPDEAYIIEYNTGKIIINILEKKEQNVEGSIETKLWAGPSLKREYELVLGNLFEVNYVFCVNNFLKKKLTSTNQKYKILNRIFNENNILLLFGDDNDYFETFDNLFSKINI